MIGVLGNISVDVVVELDKPLDTRYGKLEGRRLYFGGGGSAANVAYWLALLGERVKIFGCVGNDILGEMALKSLESVGVDTSCVKVLNTSTNVAIILSGAGSKVMIRVRSAGKECFMSLDNLSDLDILHLGSNTLEYLRKIKQRCPGVKISYDPGPDVPTLEDIAGIWAFMPNETEVRRIFGYDYENTLRDLSYEAIIVVKMLDGSINCFIDGKALSIKPLRGINVIDTTGSGDSFDAAFIHAMRSSLNITDCLSFSLVISGINSEHFGTRAPTVPWKRVIKILKENGKLSAELEEFIWEKLMRGMSD